MIVDYLIIGQGISGTWLSYFLEKAGKSLIVVDENNPFSSSRLAAGVINPVTGRRHVEVWMADRILPFAKQAYHQISEKLNITAIRETSLLDFFPSPQMRHNFMQRVGENADFVFDYPEYREYYEQFRFDFGCGEIKPVYIVHLETLLPAWRSHLKKNNCLLEETAEVNEIIISPGKIRYRDIEASAIIFCDGVGAAENPYFSLLPFAPNKGEILLAEIPGLSTTHIFKKSIVMVPLAEKHLWWIGSNYSWKFDDEEPTTAFRESTEAHLRSWLRHPFKTVGHFAGIRPATLERRPFVGMHPHHPSVGILNGMGTKGCSLAPWFANQLTEHLCSQKPIDPQVDINRFQKILFKKLS